MIAWLLILFLVGCTAVPPPYLCIRAVTADGMPGLYCEPMPRKAGP